MRAIPCRSIRPRISARRRAECYPDTELARPLRHEIRDDAVDTDRRKYECERGKERQQQHRESAVRERLVDAPIEVFAPTPSASDSMAAVVNPGVRANARTA
jgi:hypothetical protein